MFRVKREKGGKESYAAEVAPGGNVTKLDSEPLKARLIDAELAAKVKAFYQGKPQAGVFTFETMTDSQVERIDRELREMELAEIQRQRDEIQAGREKLEADKKSFEAAKAKAEADELKRKGDADATAQAKANQPSKDATTGKK